MITWKKGTTVFWAKRLPCGTRVFDARDPRHVAVVESVYGAPGEADVYTVRFENGWLANIPEQFIGVTEEE